MKTAHVAFAVAFCLVGAPAFAADLSGDEIKAQIVGKPFKWQSADGKTKGAILYAPDGKAGMTDANLPGISSDSGKWRINGNEMCVTWEKLRKGAEGCFTISGAGKKFKTSTNLEIALQ